MFMSFFNAHFDCRFPIGTNPARAGKTEEGATKTAPQPAHPHSRGENYGTEIDLIPGYGSSPLTRGKHVGCEGGRDGYGLIPAHAGKTGSSHLRV